MKLKRILIIVALMVVCSVMFSATAYASELDYWDAYDQNGETYEGHFSSLRLYCQVRKGEYTSYNTSTAEAMLYAIDVWNDADILPFTIRYRAYTSSSPANVLFYGGSYDYIKREFPSMASGGCGFTQLGSVDFHENATYGSSTKSIYEYSVEGDESWASITSVGVVIDNGYDHEVTGAHEMGHVLGWHGHSTSTSQLMYSTYVDMSVSTPQRKDKRHIEQFYTLYY